MNKLYQAAVGTMLALSSTGCEQQEQVIQEQNPATIKSTETPTETINAPIKNAAHAIRESYEYAIKRAEFIATEAEVRCYDAQREGSKGAKHCTAINEGNLKSISNFVGKASLSSVAWTKTTGMNPTTSTVFESGVNEMPNIESHRTSNLCTINDPANMVSTKEAPMKICEEMEQIAAGAVKLPTAARTAKQ